MPAQLLETPHVFVHRYVLEQPLEYGLSLSGPRSPSVDRRSLLDIILSPDQMREHDDLLLITALIEMQELVPQE